MTKHDHPPKIEVVSDEIYKNFVDSNNVPDTTLDEIAINVSRNATLSDREVAIYSSYAKEIETRLKKLKLEENNTEIEKEKEKIKELKRQVEEEKAKLSNKKNPLTPKVPNEETKEDTSTDTESEELTDQEKLDKLRADLKIQREEGLKKKKEVSQTILNSAVSQENKQIEDARNAYMAKYGTKLTEKSGFLGLRKMGHKLLNYIGSSSKDSYVKEDTKKEREAYEKEKDTKGTKTLDIFTQKRIEDRLAKYKTEGKTNEEIQALKDKYQRLISKDKNFSNRDFDFTKNENEILRTEKQKTWEAHKGMIEKFTDKTSRWLDLNPSFKKALGNKWYRAAFTGIGFGLATGGIGSLAFWGSRVARFTGGIIGGLFGKQIVSQIEKKWGTENEILLKKEKELEALYKNGKIKTGEYDTAREKIDLRLNQIKLARRAIVGASAYAGGVGLGIADSHYHFGNSISEKLHEEAGNSSIGNHLDKSTPTETQVQVKNEWLVHKGEGIEHPAIRQIESSPELQKLLGYKPGTDLHHFAQTAAHQLVSSNYVDNLGHEIRISTAGIDKAAYELRINNGAIEIHEHFNGHEVETHTDHETNIETNIEDTASEGDYEYMHTHNTHQHIENLKKSINEEFIQKKPLINMDDNLGNDVINTDSEYIEPRNIEDNNLGNDVINVDDNLDDEYIPKKALENLNRGSRLPHTFEGSDTHGDPMYNTPGYRAEPNPGDIWDNTYGTSKGGKSFLDAFDIFSSGNDLSKKA